MFVGHLLLSMHSVYLFSSILLHILPKYVMRLHPWLCK